MMASVPLFALLCILLALGCAPTPPCSPSPPAAMKEPSSRLRANDPALLQFSIAPLNHPGPAYGYVKVTLRNVSDESLWVNYRLRIDSKSARGRQVWLDVADPATGRPIEEGGCFAKGATEDDSDYMVLRPLGEYSTIRPIRCFQFPGRGPWRLVAHYQDSRAVPPAPPTGARWFNGTLTSNAIEIEVKERSPHAGPGGPEVK